MNQHPDSKRPQDNSVGKSPRILPDDDEETEGVTGALDVPTIPPVLSDGEQHLAFGKAVRPQPSKFGSANATETFTPTIYMKQGCPFCFKLRLALLEVGMLGEVINEEFIEGTPGEAAVRSKLTLEFDTISFPAAEVGAGLYKQDSDTLIAHFVQQRNIKPENLPTLQAYIKGPLAQLIDLQNSDSKRVR